MGESVNWTCVGFGFQRQISCTEGWALNKVAGVAWVAAPWR